MDLQRPIGSTWVMSAVKVGLKFAGDVILLSLVVNMCCSSDAFRFSMWPNGLD